MNIDKILQSQRDYFFSGATLSVGFRINNLKQLYNEIKAHETEISQALQIDLGKSEPEAFMCEIGMVLSEITYMIKHMKSFSKKQRVRTPLAQFYAKSYKQLCPYGNVLIMSPWNYPFLLTIEPLVDALAAGNTAIIKPSAYSPATSAVIKKIIENCFPAEYVAVVMGGRKENSELLNKKFDFIFFTGSQNVGKEVLRKAAETLTPVVLELGGKSPCIVDETADIKLAAKRIVFGKFLNCGQTCVAPDYILCHSSVKNALIGEIKKQIILQYSEKPIDNEDFGKIINKKHFDRITAMIDYNKVVLGGNVDADKLKIAPTIMDNVTWEDAIMQEEIFGPVLPVLSYTDNKHIIDILQNKQKPLALYVFSENKQFAGDITERIHFGGGCINDTIIHIATSEMGFGGVGESGMGSYHGKAGFDAFSHSKSIVDKKNWIDLPIRYQPYKRKFFRKLISVFLK